MSTANNAPLETRTSPTAERVTFQPEFLRLPPPGSACPITGLGRSFLNGLILPNQENGFKPPVKSFVLRKRGAKTGVRLIDYSDLSRHIRANETTPSDPRREMESAE